MSQVIIVSNRLPISVRYQNGKLSYYPSVGGLATGLSSYVNDKRSSWIGWPGIASDGLTETQKQTIAAELHKHNCSPVWLTQREIDDFYNGYSNRVLWPLFHEIGRQPKSDATRKRWWRSYRSVNKKFAETVLVRSETGGRIWIHDYQLLLVPQLLREQRQDILTGFFLHIPFPRLKYLSRLPEAKKLLGGMLGADMVGFHTPGYVTNFMTWVQHTGLGQISPGQVELASRIVRVSDFPMGIDYQKFADAGKSTAVKIAVKRYSRRYRRCKLIVSIDRLDPSKGLLQRLSAYRQLLKTNPGYREKVVFCMVAAPSRTDIPVYRELSKKVDRLVRDINRVYGNDKWKPVDYINKVVPFEEVTALFQVADVAFIAPIRDGMNLAAKEFVASNRRGSLILSQTAGAAHELPEALIVNPEDEAGMVEALDNALRMRRRELRRRLKRMRQQLSDNTVHTWAKDFIESLYMPVPGTPQLRTWTLRGRWRAQLIRDYRSSRRRLILMDYDGTLVPFVSDYKKARPPDSLIELLERLSADPDNTIVLVSGRSAKDLDGWFGNLAVNLIAEHGAAVKKAGHKKWQIAEKAGADWQKILKPALHRYVSLTPGSRLETKPHSLVWHYRDSPPYYAQKYGVIIKRVFAPVVKKLGLKIYQGNKILEIKNPSIHKGMAVAGWMAAKPDFVLAVGDDYTDEDLFECMPDEAYTIRVGRGRTSARFRLHGPRQAIQLFKNF